MKTLIGTTLRVKNIFLIITLTFFAFNSSNAQVNDYIYFQGENVVMPNNINTFQWNQMPEKSYYNNGYFGWLLFSEIPNQTIQNQLKANNLDLIDYIPNKAYLFYFPAITDINYLKSIGVKSIIPFTSNLKLSEKIKNEDIGDWAINGNQIAVNIQYYKKVSEGIVVSKINEIENASVVKTYKKSNIIELLIDPLKINELADIPFIKWVEVIPAPAVPEDIRGTAIHRSSNLDTQTMTGRKYTGEGIGVIVRDDGIVGPHIDFHGRIDNSTANGIGQDHGDGVAGILAGAGNLDPTKKGMAAGSDVYIVNYASSFLDTPTTDFINNGDAQITNSSYGNGCNGGYTTISQTVDSQTNSNLSLLHVFSAGNSGTSNCNYGAGSGWGNITGGHKQGKNVIATANVYYDGQLETSSSRGPAYDGRIKPDITAHGQGQQSTDENNLYMGFGGTSGAAPGIAGVSAQLYEAYMDLNGGAMPESALIKATLLNTANDYGNVGPDFQFGWGLVNGLRAAMLLEENRYLDATISQGNANNHSISIPANTKQVRFMVYWNDPAASAGSATALVNDLDLVVTNPSSTQFLPWILDPTPNATNLNTPATTGVDRLNNMEQVLINNPETGSYDIEITGFNVPSGPQHYFVVYEIITDELTLTYPIGAEKMVPGTQEVIHWDAINTTEDFVLEYSTNNGNTWNAIATVGSTTTNYTWTVPNNISGECLVRITSGSFSDTSGEVFSIASLVTGIDISEICPTEITVTWNSVANATSYEVYLLGEKYMESVGTSNTTSLSIPVPDPDASFWVAVTASGGNNWTSRRSIAVNRSGGLYNCVLPNDLSAESIINDFSTYSPICDGDTVNLTASIRNIGANDQSNFNISYQLNSEPVVTETYSGTLSSGTQINHEFSTPIVFSSDGDMELKVWTTLATDDYNGNDESTSNFYIQSVPVALNINEDFETDNVPPSGWRLENPDNARTWVKSESITGSDDQPTFASYVDGANYSTRGQEDILTTGIFDLTGDDVVLNFDLAKAQWSASYNDGLRVEISTDCGENFTEIYFKDGLDLSTIPNYIDSTWSPASQNDWRTETIDLSAYEGNTQVVFRFININDYSNSTFLDNVNVSGTSLSVAEERLNTELSLYPNPTEGIVNIQLKSMFLETVDVFDIYGKHIKSQPVKNKQMTTLSLENIATGIYFVRVKADNATVYRKIVKR